MPAPGKGKWMRHVHGGYAHRFPEGQKETLCGIIPKEASAWRRIYKAPRCPRCQDQLSPTEFIVAEIAERRTWNTPSSLRLKLEKLIRSHQKRGYLLVSFSLSQVMIAPGEMAETLLVVFRNSELAEPLPSRAYPASPGKCSDSHHRDEKSCNKMFPRARGERIKL